MVRSAAQVRSFWSRVHSIPLTMFSCAVVCQIESSRSVRSQTLTTPSPLPLANLSRELGSLAIEYTPSTWPLPSWPMNGLACIRSNLTALRALWYSRARSNGWRAESRLRGTLAASEPGGWWSARDRLRALIFMFSGSNRRVDGTAKKK